MEKFDSKVFTDMKYNNDTYELALQASQKLGMLSVDMQAVFHNELQASKVFAFIESKYSSKIEGVYTTLFDVVNTGAETNQQKIIKPLVDSLLSDDKFVAVKDLYAIEEKMNTSMDRSKRYDKSFGVYEKKDGKRVKIYEPPLDKVKIDAYLELIMEFHNKKGNILTSCFKHIWFEKVHPFVDANGRIGRLLLNKEVCSLVNYSKVLPISWAIFKNKQRYYDLFDIKSSKDLDFSIQEMMVIIMKMCDSIENFLTDLKTYKEKRIKDVLSSSTKMTEDIANEIIFNLQTKSAYLINEYGFNPRTVSNIFDKIESIDFNKKRLGREVLYWNIDLETLIDKHFGG